MTTQTDDVDAGDGYADSVDPFDVSPGDAVTFIDEDGEAHRAVAIDVFERGGVPGEFAGPYVSLVYTPDRDGFRAATEDELTRAVSVAHVDDTRERRHYSPGWDDRTE